MNADQRARSAPVVDVTTSRRPTFDAFYADNAERIARALGVALGDTQLAVDATAEAMARAWQRWPKISTYDNPAGWVWRVAMNWATSWRRRRRRERERPVSFGADRHEFTLRDDSLDAAIDSLSTDHRAVVVCRLLLDWSVDETARALDIKPGTVKSRLSRAMNELRTHLEMEEAR